MERILFVLGIILMIPALIIIVTIPMDIENEIDFNTQEIATVDVFTVHWMFAASLMVGLILIIISYKFVLSEDSVQ